jgi:leucyl aminopeptidase
MMRRNLRLGTTAELDGFDVVAVVTRSGDDGFRVDASVPESINGVRVPHAFTSEWALRHGLTDSVGSSAMVAAFGSGTVVLLSGGSEPTSTLDEWRRIGAAAAKAAGSSPIALLLALADVTDHRQVGQAIAEGAALSSYRYGDEAKDDAADFVIIPVGALPTVANHDALERGVADGGIVGAAFNWAKEQINTPAGYLTPKELAKRALAHLEGLPHVQVNSWSEPKIEDERLGGLLGVAAGSSQPPRLVYATYDPDPSGSLPHIALVGKGITFDSGGLSIKTGDGMMTMKTDMTGAATVLATIGAAAALGLQVKVTAITPITENLIGPRATKPGDVLTIRNGLTIEVLNTDAEGRLVLADGLSLAAESEPDAIIDVATLTGAQTVALGDEIGGLFASDDDLAGALVAASDVSGETMCRLPLYDGYDVHLESDVADMKNMGKPGKAGAIAAALILRKFTAGIPWAHFDIAGPGRADAVRGYYTKGATAFSGRTILEYLRSVAEESDAVATSGSDAQ